MASISVLTSFVFPQFHPRFKVARSISVMESQGNKLRRIVPIKQRCLCCKQVHLLVSATSTVSFPSDYEELLDQVKDSAQAALKDSRTLLEIEFPTAGLESVPGDAEGGIEMTNSMILVRDFCLSFLSSEQYRRTRIFFPDISEVAAAKVGVFEGTYFKLDYLTKPSGLEDIGFSRKVKIAERLKPTDEIIVVAYPYFNVNEMLTVEELYRDAAAKLKLPIFVFNGELDRIRSGYYPSFFYPKLATLAKNFLPQFETIYYIHNFKGRLGGTLFRAYPGPWQVLRKVNGEYICLLERDSMPSLKEVALDILPHT